MDKYFEDSETNKKLLKLTDEILEQFFDQTLHIRQDDSMGDIERGQTTFGFGVDPNIGLVEFNNPSSEANSVGIITMCADFDPAHVP